jgi:hypothetical protein
MLRKPSEEKEIAEYATSGQWVGADTVITANFNIRSSSNNNNISQLGCNLVECADYGLQGSIGNIPVFHRSTKQKLVSTSAMQAEIVALFESFPYISWFRDLLEELGYPQSGPSPIEQDNQSSLSLFNGSGQADTRKTRHYQNKIAFIKDQVAGGILRLQYVPTEEMLADRLTKPFGGAKMTEFFGVGT